MKRYLVILILIFQNLYSANTGFGLNNILDLSNLPKLRNSYKIIEESSRDKSGKDTDGWNGNCLYTENGKNVLFDAQGPGVIVRFYLVGFLENEIFDFYFDGDDKPTYSINIKEFFDKNTNDFPFPISLGSKDNSGGQITYTEIPFKKSLKITTTGDAFHNIEFIQFQGDFDLNSWKRNSVNQKLVDVLKNKKIENTNLKNSEKLLKNIDLLKGNEKIEIFNIQNQGVINSIRIQFPLLNADLNKNKIKDNGRSHKGKSGFQIKLNKEYDYLRIVKRCDQWAGDGQNVLTYIDGKPYYSWYYSGFDYRFRWRDMETVITKDRFDGKKEINLEFVYDKSNYMNRWNEYFYWIYGNNKLIDSIDIGNIDSEQSHKYFIEQEDWHGENEFYYYETNESILKLNNILKELFIKCVWDDDTTKVVYMPFSHYFGVGSITKPESNNFLFGIDSTKTLFNYFPAPFFKNAKIYLVNNSKYDIDSLNIELILSENKYKEKEVGKLYANFATYKDEKFDMLHLNLKGEGHIVNHVTEVFDINDVYLESNARLYIDGNKSPQLSSTGTEDFFNCGFYFRFGPIYNPFHGLADSYSTNKTMYRHFIADPISFSDEIKVYFQYLNYYTTNPLYRVSYLYYLNYKSSIILSDSLNIGNILEENQHNYNSTNRSSIRVNSYFEGVFRKVLIEDEGNLVQDESNFEMKIEPNNYGAKLTRVFDYKNLNQKSEVYIDNDFVGIWYNGGFNDSLRFKEDCFIIPKSFAQKKDKINIKIKNITKNGSWSEHSYKIYSIIRENLFESIINPVNDNSIPENSFIYPNPAKDYIFVCHSALDAESISLTGLGGRLTDSPSNKSGQVGVFYEIYNIFGEKVEQTFLSVQTGQTGMSDPQRIDISNLPAGVYFIKAGDNFESKMCKFIKID